MAGCVPSISRRRVLGAAAALSVLALGGQLPATLPGPSPSRRLWARRLARYRRLAAAAEEAAETGWFREANDRYEREAGEIAVRFGQSEEGRRLRRAAFERMSAAEDAYWERCTAPMKRAAVTLSLTLAPDIAAVRDKIGVMRAVHLQELDTTPGACFELIEEDLGRLLSARLK